MTLHVKGKSGNHPAVVAYRAAENDIQTSTLPAIEALNARLDRALETAREPESFRVDARREPDGDEDIEIPIDVVDLPPPSSAPSPRPPRTPLIKVRSIERTVTRPSTFYAQSSRALFERKRRT